MLNARPSVEQVEIESQELTEVGLTLLSECEISMIAGGTAITNDI